MHTEINLGDPIVDYALETKENLLMAQLIAEAWPKLRASITAEFLRKLNWRVRETQPKTGVWIIQGDGDNVIEERWLQPVYLSKTSWAEKFYVSLELQEFGKTCVLGIWRDRNKESRLDSGLADLFRKEGIQFRSNQWWAAQLGVEPEVSNWCMAETLGCLRFDSDKWSKQFAEWLWNLATMVESLVDKFYENADRE